MSLLSPRLRSLLRPARAAMLAAPARHKAWEMHDPLDHVTGIQKRELLAALAGDCDPFHLMPIKRGAGTRERPNLVPSAFDKRIMGCVCEPGTTPIRWIYIHAGTPKRCECGHWFELCAVPPL